MVPEVWGLYPKTEEMHEPLHFDSGDGTKVHVFFVDVTKEDTNLNELKAMIQASIREIKAPFRFSMCNIQPGEEIEFCNTASEFSGEVCVVDKQVQYEGKVWSLSTLSTILSNTKWGVAGSHYFKYKDEWLNDIRERCEKRFMEQLFLEDLIK